MPLLSAPFYGSISRMSVNPQDNSLWMITKHPMGRSISPVRLNVQGLIETHKVNDHTQSFDIDGVAVDVLGHQTGVYVVVNNDGNGEIHRFDGTAFVPVYTCDGSFGLQAIVGFDDAKTSFPHMTSDSVQMNGGHNKKLLLVGRMSLWL